ncbi:hypothetical protein GCM10020295_01930 [Streptomyces cinereospinus]
MVLADRGYDDDKYCRLVQDLGGQFHPRKQCTAPGVISYDSLVRVLTGMAAKWLARREHVFRTA